MRLIDADLLMEKLNVFKDREHGNEHFLYGIETAKELLEDTPTAYDVEKVVNELENIKTGGDCRYKCKNYDWSVGGCEGYCEDYVREKTIEIVRKGGVE